MKHKLLIILLVLALFVSHASAETNIEISAIKNLYKEAEQQLKNKYYKDCLETSSQIIKKLPKDQQLYSEYHCKAVSLKAMCLAKLGNYDETKKEISAIYNTDLETFAGASDVCGKYIPSNYLYPQILSATGKYEEAIQYQDKYINFLRNKNKIQIDDIIIALNEKALILYKNENYEQSLEVYNYLLSLKLAANDDLNSKIGKAKCYGAMNDYNSALSILNDILADDYTNIANINKLYNYRFQHILGMVRLLKFPILAKLNKSKELFELSDEVEKNNIIMAQYHANFIKAKAYELQKDYENSLVFVEEAIKNAPPEMQADVQKYKQKLMDYMKSM